MHKKILSFVQVLSHSVKVITKTVVKCLDIWGLNNVLSVTIDNAALNDHGVDNLKRWLWLRNNLVLNEDHFLTRWCADAINLVVKAGVKKLTFLFLEYGCCQLC